MSACSRRGAAPRRPFGRRRSIAAGTLLLAVALVAAFAAMRPPSAPIDAPALAATGAREFEPGTRAATGAGATGARVAAPEDGAAAGERGTAGAPRSTAWITTFADGEPVRSLLHDVASPGPMRFDWNDARPRHDVPAAGARFVLAARGCDAQWLDRAELPEQGEGRFDLVRAPVLDVRLVRVPPGIRERLALRLQVEFGERPQEQVRASILLGGAPVEMVEDRVLVPLTLRLPGQIVVHACSRHSTHSYATPKVPFEPVSQVVELDCSALAAACALADLSLTLRFPYAHPDGELDLSLLDGNGSTMMYQRRGRDGDRELRYVFRDLPRARVRPLLWRKDGAGAPIHLPEVDLGGGDVTTALDVVAESSLRVVVGGRDGLAADGVSVLLRREGGHPVGAHWPRGGDCRFEHLPAAAYWLQAIAYDGHRCSRVVRVDLGVSHAHELALELVPGAEVSIAPGAFGGAPFADVHGAGAPEPSRVWLASTRETRVWLPAGDARVAWPGGAERRRIEAGVLHRWP